MRLTITDERSEKSEIFCEAGAFERLRGSEGMVFTDSNVYALYRDKIRQTFPSSPVFVMQAGEENKNKETLFSLLSAMAEAGLHRKDKLICVGGGVVGDVGGLASALYMRGIDCVQVPTTLLSQVDSSIGGKTAVDFNGVKNLVGAFKQPREVVVDGEFLKTLPAREIRCGLGEIVKHSALDGSLFEKLTQNEEKLFDLDFLFGIVPDNLRIKADFVARDAREGAVRKFLNLGHTTAHAYELADGKLSHGEYVLIGLIFEAEIARKFLPCDREYLKKLQSLCRSALQTKPILPPVREVSGLAKLDKKNSSAARVTLAVPAAKAKYALLELDYGEYVARLDEAQEVLV